MRFLKPMRMILKLTTLFFLKHRASVTQVLAPSASLPHVLLDFVDMDCLF